LVPGMIVKMEPLTIMAIANMTARDGAATVNGCYCLEVKELDGAQKILFEKIPCSCFFCYEGGDYHSSFQPHPLYWGTADQQSVQEALRQVEEDNKENPAIHRKHTQIIAELLRFLTTAFIISSFCRIRLTSAWMPDFTLASNCE